MSDERSRWRSTRCAGGVTKWRRRPCARVRRDVRLKTAPSKIHGVGLFADECFEDGDWLGWMSGRVVCEGVARSDLVGER